MRDDVSVVVVTYNSLPWLERCLESVRGYETIVVDNGSCDGSVDVVRDRFPEARLIRQGNVGMGGGNNAGMRAATGRYFFLLNADAWVVDDAVETLARFADATPDAAVVGPRLRNLDGTLQRSARSFPTPWRLATEYLFIRRLAPRTNLLNPLYLGGFDHASTRAVDWLYGPALLVRRDAADAVGLFDEAFFMFSEEVDWMYRFARAGWKTYFHPDAEVVHVGGASHGGRLYVENLRGHLRFAAKHHGPAGAERTRRLLLASLRLRAALFRGARGEAYREGVRFLSSGAASTLL